MRNSAENTAPAAVSNNAHGDGDAENTRVAARYAVGITDHVRTAMRGGLADNDPVALQYIPQPTELNIRADENTDPIGDFAHTPIKGIVHRHENRVLLKLANVCAVYCRYCFRRDMIGPGADVLNKTERAAAYDYIRANPQINEVILTGGDPLVLSARNLSAAMDALCDINHITNIRIHTRVPIADPARITDATAAALTRDTPIYMVLHINHAQEITPAVRAALKTLHDAGCVLLSQSVLLRGVNDDADVLAKLCDALIGLNVKPYYIHHPDKAVGTAHFRLSIARGRKIMRDLQTRISGLALPRYMLDIPGGYGKVPLNADHVTDNGDGSYKITDTHGGVHDYSDNLPLSDNLSL